LAASLPAKLASSKRNRALLLLLFAILAALSAYKAHACYELASKLEGYASDEVWYVPSSRTIAQEVFGAEPRYEVDGLEVYTVFASTARDLEAVEAFVTSQGGFVVRGGYVKVAALAVAFPGSRETLARVQGAAKVLAGYPYPDEERIHEYYNFEHPPLGKYVIGLSMLALGDRPLSWRLPSIAAAAAIVVFAGLAGFRTLGFVGGAVAGLAAALDPLTTNMGAVAMLDIQVAALVALSLLALSYGRYAASVAFIALAGAVKLPGLFFLPALYIAMRARGVRASKAAALVALLPAAALAASYAPLLAKLGAREVVEGTLRGLAWHLTSRPPGPPTSTPLEWFFGLSSFYLSYEPPMAARGSPLIYVPSLVFGLALLPAALSRDFFGRQRKLELDLSLALASFLACFCAIYALGNRTFYSFYLTDAAPVAYLLLPAFLSDLLSGGELTRRSLSKLLGALEELRRRGRGRESRATAEGCSSAAPSQPILPAQA